MFVSSSGSKCFARYFLSTLRIKIGKTGACGVLIFGAEVIYLFIIYIFSTGNCLPLALLLNTAVCSTAAEPEVVLTST